MATAPETTPRRRKGASIVVWILMALLIVSLGGFGVTNFGGGVTTIGAVGDREITATRYARALQQELAATGAQIGQPLTLAQAQQFGLDQRVRQQLITAAALDDAAARIPLSVGDARVAQEIRAQQAFQGGSGQFDPEAYRFTLERNNLTIAEFEAEVRADLTRALLQGTVAGGFAAPAALTETLYAYVAERRGFSLLRLAEADLPAPVAAPTESELQAFYEANIADFTRPEAKRITYAALLPEDLAATLPVDEAALREAYEGRRAEFVQPERRLVERLVYPTEAEAQAARARLDAGEATFDALVAERGLTLADVDLGDPAREDLGEAGDAVFALTGPGVVGPLPSEFGPALFRMNAILSAQETTFEEARPDLTVKLRQEAARRAIAGQVEAIDDRLAGGATLEDLNRELGLTLGTIDFSADSDASVAAYPAFREAATALAEGDFPEAVLLDDGGVAVLRLDEIVPPTPIPLDEARADVAAAWRAERVAAALADRAAAILAEVQGGADLASFGAVAQTPEIARDGFVENAPQDFLSTVFAMQPGEVRVVAGEGFAGVVRLDAVTPAAAEGDGPAALRGAIAAQAEQGIAQDAFALFGAALADEAGITLDQAAIDAVHAQFP